MASHEPASGSTLFDVTESLLIGAGAGLTSTAIIALCAWGWNWWVRREQVRFIQAYIMKCFDDLENTPTQGITLPDGTHHPWGHLLLARYREFMRGMDNILVHRTTKLSYKLLTELHAAASGDQTLVEHATRPYKNNAGQKQYPYPNNLDFYRRRYQEYQGIDGICLPAT